MYPQSSGGPDVAVPESFHCEHSAAKSRVMVLVKQPGTISTLHAVLSCADPLLAERAADLLSQAARTGGGPLLRREIDLLAALLPDAPRASFIAAADTAAAGQWPDGGAKMVAEQELLDSYSFAQAGDMPATPEGRDAATREPNDDDLVLKIESICRIRIHDPARLLARARAGGWEPDPDAELDGDPQDILGAALFLFDYPQVAGTDVIDLESEGGYASSEAIPEMDAVDKIGFSALFPLGKEQIADEDGDSGHDSWRLTPKTAFTLHTALCVLADEAFDDSTENDDAPVDDGDEGDWMVFDRLPRITWPMNHQWRRQFARAADDLASDLKAGRWPEPRSFAEEMCLHLALQDAEAFEEQADQTQGLDEHELDYDWDGCREYFFQDFDILHLSNPTMEDVADPGSAINQQFGIGDMRPVNWFETFGNTEPRDPGRGFRR